MNKLKNKTYLALIITLVLIFPAVITNADDLVTLSGDYKTTDISPAKWTIMIYYAADNHRDPEIDSYLDIFKSIGSDDSLKIISLVDGREKDDTTYYYTGEDFLTELYWPENESNMGEASTLEKFLNTTIENYPADNYALFILSTHGSGWQGLGGDTDGTGKVKDLSLLNMKDYKTVLQKITDQLGKKINVIAFEICITGMIEVAYQMSPYVDYMIGTEEHGFGRDEPSDEGHNIEWNYTFFLQNLKNNPDMTPEDFSSSIVDCYTPGTYTFKILEKIKAPRFYPILKCYTTISAVNLSRLNLTIDSLTDLSSLITDDMKDYRRTITNARSKVREYGKLYRKYWFLPSRIYSFHIDTLGYNCFIDLYDFVETLKNTTDKIDIKNACEEVTDSLNQAIIANKALPTDHSNGLSIYFPERKCQYDISIWRAMGNPDFWNIPLSYEELEFSKDSQWDELIKTYLRI